MNVNVGQTIGKVTSNGMPSLFILFLIKEENTFLSNDNSTKWPDIKKRTGIMKTSSSNRIISHRLEYVSRTHHRGVN